MSGFLPNDYDVPKGSSRFFSTKEPGVYRIRILSQPVLGFHYWVDDNGKNKKTRVKFGEEDKIPEKIAADKRIHFWAVKIFNYTVKQVQVWELTQKSMMKTIKELAEDKDWGDPFAYDLKITKKGSGKQTEYSVTPSPKKQLTDEETKIVAETKVVMDNIFIDENPFVTGSTNTAVNPAESEVDPAEDVEVD